MMAYCWPLILLFAIETDRHSAAPTVIVVRGAPGSPEYEEQFLDWSDRWQSVAVMANARFVRVGDDATTDLNNKRTDLGRLKSAIEKETDNPTAALWLVLLGHGTFDGQTAKFNLRGPDVSSDELAAWLAPLKQPVVIINCASASAPFMNKLAGDGRIIITATRSGNEQNFARFGGFLSSAIANPQADLDKDDQVSLLEAYLSASRQVAEYYEQQSRLATEHALLDDNGDGLGTPEEWFRGVRAVRSAKDGRAVDGVQAHQLHLVTSDREAALTPAIRERRNKLEVELAELRADKSKLAEDEYFRRLERLLVELAKLYDSVAAKEVSRDSESDAEKSSKPLNRTSN